MMLSKPEAVRVILVCTAYDIHTEEKAYQRLLSRACCHWPTELVQHQVPQKNWVIMNLAWLLMTVPNTVSLILIESILSSHQMQ